MRHKGTIGGSLANNDPTADYPAAVLALGATIVTNKRRLKAEEFFQGLFETSLEHDEIITVMFPVPKKAAYIKFRNQARAMRWSACLWPRRSVGRPRRRHRRGLGRRVPRRLVRGSPEEALLAEGARRSTVPADGLNSDLHGSAEYRAHLIAVLTRRAVEAATGKA